jgi:MFS family permease
VRPSQKNIPRTAWITLAILGFIQIITMYGETMLLPAIPDIIKEFYSSYSAASWILSSYFVAGAIAIPIVGRLSDIYGRKKMLVVVMIFYILGIGIGGLSSDITILITARVFQGVGISLFPIAFAIIKDQFPKEKLAIAIGGFTSMSAVGSVVGLVVGASIIESFGWRFTFFSILPLAVGLWVTTMWWLRDKERIPEDFVGQTKKEIINAFSGSKLTKRNINISTSNSIRSIDLKGIVTLAAAITSFLILLSNSQGDLLSGSVLRIGLLSTGIISLILFLLVERRSDSPLVNFQLLTNKVIISANMILLISFLTTFAVFQTVPVLVRSPQPLGLAGEAMAIANIQIPFLIVFLIFAPFSGVIVTRLGNIKPTILGSIITSAGFFSLYMFHSTSFSISSNLAIVAAGLSLMRVGGLDIILESTPSQYSGISLGMTALFKMIGSSIGPVVAGILMQTNQTNVKGVLGSFPSPESYNLIFFTLTLASFTAVVLSSFIMKSYHTYRLVNMK